MHFIHQYLCIYKRKYQSFRDCNAAVIENPEISFFNYVNLHGAPKSACFEFPPAHGYTFFTDHFAHTFTGSHRPTCDYVQPYELLEHTDFLQNEAEIYVNMLEVFCKTNNIPLTMFSYFPTTLPITRININLLGIEDNNKRFARDICKQNFIFFFLVFY